MGQGFTPRRLKSALVVGGVATLGFGIYHLIARDVGPIFMILGSVASFLAISLMTYMALGYSSRFT